MRAGELPLASLVPHAGPMLLLDEVIACGAVDVQARATPRDDGLFAAPGAYAVPAWLGLEYLAQAIAAWSGYHELMAGRTVRPGVLVGTQRFTSNVGRLPVGAPLTIAAERIVGGAGAINVFEGRVSGDGIEQTTQIKVLLPDDGDPLW